MQSQGDFKFVYPQCLCALECGHSVTYYNVRESHCRGWKFKSACRCRAYIKQSLYQNLVRQNVKNQNIFIKQSLYQNLVRQNVENQNIASHTSVDQKLRVKIASSTT